MAKDLLYRPDLSYDKSYYTDGKLYDLTEDIHINSQDEQDNLSNKLNHIDDLLKDIISKLPIIPEDLLDVFLPPFITVNDVLKDLIDNKDKIPSIPQKPEPDIIIKDESDKIEPVIPDPNLPPSDPFGIEEDVIIGIPVLTIPENEELEREYILDLVDVLEDYIIKFNEVIDKYMVNVVTTLSLSDYSSLKLITTKQLQDTNLSHVTDYLTKSQIGLKQQLKLYHKIYSIDETIFHIRSIKVANEQRKRYKTNKKLKDVNAITKSANDLLRESNMVAQKKYEENFYGLYKYLNSSVILFNECTNTTIKQKQALVLVNNKEREK
jgi:hypothetical protein